MYICKIQIMFVELSEQTVITVYKNLSHPQAQKSPFLLVIP